MKINTNTQTNINTKANNIINDIKLLKDASISMTTVINEIENNLINTLKIKNSNGSLQTCMFLYSIF